MKHAAAWLVALGLSLTSPTLSQAEGQHMSDQEKAVKHAIETMTSAFENANIDAVMQSYEGKASILFEPGNPASDPDLQRKLFTEFASINPNYEYAGHEVVVTGDIALHIAPWTMTAKTPDGQTISQSGLSVAVLRQQNDGSWKMVIDNPHGSHLLAAAE